MPKIAYLCSSCRSYGTDEITKEELKKSNVKCPICKYDGLDWMGIGKEPGSRKTKELVNELFRQYKIVVRHRKADEKLLRELLYYIFSIVWKLEKYDGEDYGYMEVVTQIHTNKGLLGYVPTKVDDKIYIKLASEDKNVILMLKRSGSLGGLLCMKIKEDEYGNNESFIENLDIFAGAFYPEEFINL